MAKRIVQMHDKHKSTTNLYPKVTMGSLSPQVKAYIEGQGDDKFVRAEVKALNETIVNEIVNKETVGGLLFQTRKPEVAKRGAIGIDNSSILLEVEDNSVANSGYGELELRKDNFKVRFTDSNLNSHTLTFDANGDLKVDGQAVGGGKTLYQHNILLSHTNANYRIFVSIINDSATPMTEDDLISYLNDRNYVVKANGSFYDSGSHIVWGLYKYSSTQYNVCYQRMSDGSISTSWLVNKGFFTFTDNVETL